MTLGRLGHNESYFSLTFHARGFLKELRGNNNNCVLSVPKRRNDTLTDYPNACETLRCPDETRTIHGCEEAHFPHAWARRGREDRRRREEKDAARGERGKGGRGLCISLILKEKTVRWASRMKIRVFQFCEGG